MCAAKWPEQVEKWECEFWNSRVAACAAPPLRLTRGQKDWQFHQEHREFAASLLREKTTSKAGDVHPRCAPAAGWNLQLNPKCLNRKTASNFKDGSAHLSLGCPKGQVWLLQPRRSLFRGHLHCGGWTFVRRPLGLRTAQGAERFELWTAKNEDASDLGSDVNKLCSRIVIHRPEKILRVTLRVPWLSGECCQLLLLCSLCLRSDSGYVSIGGCE